MCGITGAVSLGRAPIDPTDVRRMAARQAHRGPDHQGEYVGDGIVLASQRLAIIDVAGGNQPIANEDGSVVIVYSGELYNYRELRTELVGRGHRFATRADTEVLVHAYEDDGVDFLTRLNGMFAFALWDARARRWWYSGFMPR
jgi:asparagine synthase (glutamine-hydrolysing)